MDRDEALSTRIWLEEHENRAVVTKKQQRNFKIHKFNKTTLSSIQQFSKKNKISWEILITSAWGFLLNHFCTNDMTNFGITTLVAKGKDSFKIQFPIKPIKSVIDEKVTIETFIKKMKTQHNKKTIKKNITENEFRYLLLFKNDHKSKKSTTTNLNLHPLNLIAAKKINKEVSLLFNPKIYNDESIESIFHHLELFIQRFCQNNLKQKITKINLLTHHEQNKILNEWKAPEYDFIIPKLSGCFHDLFSKQSEIYPDAIAINHNDLTITYGELEEQSNVLARMLLNKGIKSSEPIAVLMDRTPQLIIIMLAIFKAGAIYVPINPKYPSDRIEYILGDCQANYILTNQPEHIPEKFHPKIINVAEWNQFIHGDVENFPQLTLIFPDSIAYIIYTSGTTGNPKGVMIKHISLVNLVAWYQGCFNVTNQDKASQFASQAFDTYLCEVIPFLASGASVHIVDDNIKLTPSLFFEWLVNQEITICDLPTSYAQMIFAMQWPKNSKLRLMKIGGETVTHYPTQTFAFDIWNGYGPTEATIEATFIKLCSLNTSYKTVARHYPPPIGKPICNTEIFVVNKYLQPVPIGVAGELLIGGIGVSTGYLNRPDLTSEKFIPHIFDSKNSSTLYRTGDLVRWLPDGNLEFIGRIDHQIKIRGYRIELGDIESVISQHPDVNEVAVLVKESGSKEKSIVAYIVPNLNRNRYLYQERCLLSISDNKFIETVTEDISKGGIGLSNVTENLNIGDKIRIKVKLPGLNASKQFYGFVIWQHNERCGIAFDLNEEDKQVVEKSIEYYLSTHNMMDLILSAASKRSLRKALRTKIPEYMIPNSFVSLLQFPLTFSGKIDTKALPLPEEFEQIVQNEFIPPKTEMEKQLSKIWCQILDKKTISMSDNFFDLGASSLNAAQLSVEILNNFQIAVPAKILFDLPYIPILAEYIDSNGESYTQESNIQMEIIQDCKLDENIFPTNKLSPFVKEPQSILLTGAGGFLGIYFLKELLENTNAKIYCLVRKGEFESPVKKLMSNIKKFNLDKDILLSNRRLIIIGGDISYHDFGLPQEQYDNLVSKIDLIYHCGAQVNIMASYNKLRGSNVQGTLEIIKFATTGIDKPIHYISTLSSATVKDESGSLTEEFPSTHYEELYGGYALSKWVSERLLVEVNNRGLPITIYRSGYISGQSNSGITNLNDALLLLVKGCIQLGYAPNLDEKMTILPVDFVAKAIVQISLKHPDGTNVYHVDHPTGILWTDLVSWLNDYGYKIKIIPLKKWQELLTTITSDNALFSFLPYYLSLKEQRPPEVSVVKATAVLQHCQLPYPEINEQLLSIYFDYLCRVDFLPFPHEKKESTFGIT